MGRLAASRNPQGKTVWKGVPGRLFHRVASSPACGYVPSIMKISSASGAVKWMIVAACWHLPIVAWPAGALQITNQFHVPGAFSFAWSAPEPGMAYTVQYRETVADSIWLMPSHSEPWPIPATQWTDLNASLSPTRFYRVLSFPAAQRGKVLSNTYSTTVPTNFINLMLSSKGITSFTAKHDVRLYKVIYETITPWGDRTRASGALALPVGVGKPLPLFSYQHGTITQTNAAPSSMNYTGGEAGLGVIMASQGYAAALPDYLGLGSSPGFHPYHHARSEATAGVDMLRAVRAVCSTNGFPLTNKLFLTGYSQGGHAVMALCRELETYHAPEFEITACAPMAGAYDMSGVTADDFLSTRLKPNPYYFAYLLAAYQDVYHLAPTFADLLAPPYNTTLPPLLQGNSSGDTINNAIKPADPIQILKPELLAAFRNNPNHPLRQALRENDLYAWTPRCPMRLYHCAADQDVIEANSQVAYASFQAHGATQVQLIDPNSSAGHGDCATPALLLAKTWFDSLR